MSRIPRSLTIGELARVTGLTHDTLRYYERIGLLGRVPRDAGGRRRYPETMLSRLNFIRRAQKMDFSLAEIKDLLRMRDDPRHVRDQVRRMTADKLTEVRQRIEELSRLRDELTLLLNLCRGSEGGCPIIEGIDGPD